MGLRVLAVDDQPAVVTALLHALTSLGTPVELVGVQTSAQDLADHLSSDSRPAVDLALLDLALGDRSSPEESVRLLTRSGIPTLLLTAEVLAEPIAAAVRAGARGLALKSDPAEHTLSTVGRVARGDVALTPDLAFVLLCDPQVAGGLTAQESEILALVAEGAAVELVGQELAERLDPEQVQRVVNDLHRRLQQA